MLKIMIFIEKEDRIYSQIQYTDKTFLPIIFNY